MQVRYAAEVMGVEGVGIGTHFNSAVLPWVVEGLLDAGFSGGGREQDMRREIPASLARGAARVVC